MPSEYAFEIAPAAIRFGFGVTREVGAELADLGKRRALVIADPNLRNLPVLVAVQESLEEHKIQFSVFDRVRVEPTDESLLEATAAAQAEEYDAFVAVGGGSTIDTAKAANLYSCYPADLLEYVNPPIGKGKPVPGPLKPLIAIPTTAGTGSETTGVAIFDYVKMHAKTGIAHRRLKPTLGLIDPENTRTQPPAVAASSGLDVLSHAVESYTALPFDQRPRPERPLLRPAYQGSNPISDVWSLESLRLVSLYLERAARDTRRPGSARLDDAGGGIRGHWIRQRRRASAARNVVPRVRTREKLPRAGLRRGSCAGAPRHFGDPERTCRLSLYCVCLSGATPARGRDSGRKGRWRAPG